MDLKELQRYQEEYDTSYWEHNASKLDKIRHITLHLAKSLGKISGWCERAEHQVQDQTKQIETEVIPDLLVYCLQLSNTLRIDAEEAFHQRVEENKKRFKKLSP